MRIKRNLCFLAVGIITVMAGCESKDINPALPAAIIFQEENNNDMITETEIETKAEVEEVQMQMAEYRYIDNLSEYQGGAIIAPDSLDFDKLENYFSIAEISDEVFSRIFGYSFKEDCSTKKEDLSYIKLLHYGFEGEIRVGEIIASKYIAEDLCYIFRELFNAEYPIEKILLIDEYEADDTASMLDNNSSCFNFRQIAGSTSLSKHSLGLAIDINPYYNPYIRYQNGHQVVEPAGSEAYANREDTFPYKIDTDDLCYQLFISRGFTWGGSWNSVKDYQHFEKSIELIND